MALKQYFDRKDMYIYPWYISDLAATSRMKEVVGVNVSQAFMVIVNDFLNFYYDEDSSNKIGRAIFDKIVADKNFFQKVINNIYKYSDELLAFCGHIPAKERLASMDHKELLVIYKEYIDRLEDLRIWGFVPVFLDGMDINFLTDYIQEKLKKHLESIGQVDHLSQYYSILSSSEKTSEVQAEELARLGLLLEISKAKNAEQILAFIKNKDIEALTKEKIVCQLLNKHLQDFGWLTYGYAGPIMQMDYLLKSLNNCLSLGDIKEQKDTIVSHYDNVTKEKEELIKKIKLPEEAVYLFKVSSEFMFIKDYRKGIYQKSYVAMDKVMAELAHRLGISLKGIRFTVIDDVKEGLLNHKDYKDIIKKRLQKCCYQVINGRAQVFEGNECDKLIKEKIGELESKKVHKDVSELKGMVAYSGLVKGTVKIVLTKDDIDKVKEGDILVSSATNPDLIIAMKLASAIVTDTGGIISHAAIVSRELKKPCIVGTKIATKVLKDGDLVEVDAKQGVVKKLSK